MNKQIIKKCNKIANYFLELATQFKALSHSLERTTNKKELILIKRIIKNKVTHLEIYFNNIKGGLKNDDRRM